MTAAQHAAPSPLFEVEFTFTLEEWREAVLTALRKERRSNVWVLVAAIGLLAGGLSPLLDDLEVSEHRITLGAVFLVYALWQILAPRWRLRRSWQEGLKDERITVCLTRDHFISRNSEQRTEVIWHAFSHFSETPRLFLIHVRSGSVMAFPKRSIGDDVRVDAVRAILLDRIGRTSEQTSRGFPVTPAAAPASESLVSVERRV